MQPHTKSGQNANFKSNPINPSHLEIDDIGESMISAARKGDKPHLLELLRKLSTIGEFNAEYISHMIQAIQLNRSDLMDSDLRKQRNIGRRCYYLTIQIRSTIQICFGKLCCN
jgi:hypothetical protein